MWKIEDDRKLGSTVAQMPTSNADLMFMIEEGRFWSFDTQLTCIECLLKHLLRLYVF